jgi:hypothetical protein
MRVYSPFVSAPYFSILTLSFMPEFARFRREESRIPGGSNFEPSIFGKEIEESNEIGFFIR